MYVDFHKSDLLDADSDADVVPEKSVLQSQPIISSPFKSAHCVTALVVLLVHGSPLIPATTPAPTLNIMISVPGLMIPTLTGTLKEIGNFTSSGKSIGIYNNLIYDLTLYANNGPAIHPPNGEQAPEQLDNLNIDSAILECQSLFAQLVFDGHGGPP
ncbi:hypothetical protein SERLADRAFT_442744 [Serpula lacrymans var. lacrymans S7.9]|uniref:Uncharacterized protein n=1 Tax=Serpula lacrymans var. lacrymans (strain S7.9) TaxID=578457 RepID=F8PAU0_SERL9|nr:uncharacterized protein SERLADRAFT_442744 [Serpula lacrymans var. lacrymans S7.9]EGO19928.1 hypothetical protein SERLADRAFT_442744 [Serpula lacrymans var. lacrymans S7.9]